MVTLNFLVPILSWLFIFTDNNIALNECLGKGYLNFLSTEVHYCKKNDIFCWIWLSLLSIFMANIIDVYCVYQCIKDIKQSTDKSRDLLSKQAYTNRKRYVIVIIFWGKIVSTEFCFKQVRINLTSYFHLCIANFIICMF